MGGDAPLLPGKFASLTIELELVGNYADFQDANANPWNLEDCKLLVSMVQPNPDVTESLFGALARGQSLNIRVPTIHCFSQTIASSGLAVINVSRSCSRLRQCQISFSLASQKLARSFPKPADACEIQMAIGSRLFPQHGNLKSTPEFWYETMKALGDVQMTGKNNLQESTYSATDATGRFALALSTREGGS